MARRPALMSRGRRYLAAVVLALLALPALGMLVSPHEVRSVMERRLLATLPPAPRSLADAVAWPRAMDAYVRDHFAGRTAMVGAGLRLQAQAALKPRSSVNVVEGQGDWLLLRLGLMESAGAETDPATARRYAAFVCALAREVKARGAAFLFAPLPGPVEVYPEALPPWIARASPTQPELVLQSVRACGVQTLDLRPAMAAAKGLGRLYQHHDSHWTNIGALVAYNAMAQALGQPWAIAPRDMHWRPAQATQSDLVRLSGALDLAPEILPEPPEGPDSRPTDGGLGDLDHGINPPAFEIPGARPGPPLLIVGDSYTSDYMAQYFRRSGPSLAWIHQDDCRFDRRILERVRPAWVVLAPADRQETCR